MRSVYRVFKLPQHNLCVAAVCNRTVPWREHRRIRVKVLWYNYLYEDLSKTIKKLRVDSLRPRDLNGEECFAFDCGVWYQY